VIVRAAGEPQQQPRSMTPSLALYQISIGRIERKSRVSSQLPKARPPLKVCAVTPRPVRWSRTSLQYMALKGCALYSISPHNAKDSRRRLRLLQRAIKTPSRVLAGGTPWPRYHKLWLQDRSLSNVRACNILSSLLKWHDTEGQNHVRVTCLTANAA